jgi:hypothetical protein
LIVSKERKKKEKKKKEKKKKKKEKEKGEIQALSKRDILIRPNQQLETYLIFRLAFSDSTVSSELRIRSESPTSLSKDIKYVSSLRTKPNC